MGELKDTYGYGVTIGNLTYGPTRIGYGVELRNPQEVGKPPEVNEPGKRLSVAIDWATYKRLRRHAAYTGGTHQAILVRALAEYLERITLPA